MANGYSIGMTGGVMPNPMGVVGNTRTVTSTMGMTGGVMPAPLAPFIGNLPQSNSPVIVVSESTPNLMEIQNFPVVSRNGIFHIHQDPRTGQRYSMTDEFHMRIPQILASRQNSVVNNSTQRSVINYQIVNVDEDTENIQQILSFQPYLIREEFTLYNEKGSPILYRVSKNLSEKFKGILSSRGTGVQNIRVDSDPNSFPISDSRIFDSSVNSLLQSNISLLSSDPSINTTSNRVSGITGGEMKRPIVQTFDNVVIPPIVPNTQQTGVKIIQQTRTPINTYVMPSAVTNTSPMTNGISSRAGGSLPFNTYYSR